MSDVQVESTGEENEHDAAVSREQELEASRRGWQPKHKYKGAEGGWKDAATFLADGAKFNGRLQDEVASLKRELAEFKGTAKQFSDFQQRQIESRDAQIGDLVRDLKRQQREAIRNGDDDAADAIDDRIGILQDEHQKVKTDLEKTKQTPRETASGTANGVVDENGNTNDPTVKAWIADGNQWFNDSKPMRDYCFAVANELMDGGETRRGRAFLDLIGEKMREAFPLKFGESRTDPTRRGSMTESGGSTSTGGVRHTVNDLPEADRELMKVGIRQGWTTEASFLKNYFDDAPHIHRTAEKKK
jgi:uncharacterized small protein (DUF1192 family)